MRLILVRHGETESNRQRLGLGREDVPLNEQGRRQAAAVAAALGATAITAVYSSPLARAREMADAIAAAHALDVREHEALVEMDVGELEGLTSDDMRSRYGDFLRRWLSPEAADLRMPGGESLREVQERAWTAIEELRAAHEGATVVAVSHNFTISTIICRALNLPLADFRRVRQELAATSMIEMREEGPVVASLNDTCHLDGLREGRAYWSPG